MNNTPTPAYPTRRHSAIRAAFEVLLPAECLVCTRPLRGHSLCYRCRPPLPNLTGILRHRCPRCFEPRATIPTNALSEATVNPPDTTPCPTCLLFPSPADSIRFLWEYGGLPRDFIRCMKYRPSQCLAHTAGHLVAQSIPFLYERASWDLIIPVPSSTHTFRKRLFHPCAEMAQSVSRTLGLPVRHLLRHERGRTPQARLHHDARLRRLSTLFSVRGVDAIRGRRILLIEDVITTGATLSAAAFQLRRAGAARADVLALARARAWNRFRQRIWERFPISLDVPGLYEESYSQEH